MMIRQTDDQAFSRDSKRERPLSVITHLKRGGGGGKTMYLWKTFECWVS